MVRRPGLIIKLAAFLLIATSIIVGLNFKAGNDDAASPVLPTLMSLPTLEATAQSPSADATQPVMANLYVVQPTAIPPTSAPPEPVQPVVSAATGQPLAPEEIASAEPPLTVPPSQPVPDQITVQFKPGTSADEQAAYIQALGGTVIQNIAPLNTVVLTVPDGVSAQAVLESPVVAQAEPDYFVTAQQYASNDPYFNSQWALPVMNTSPAWELVSGAAPIVVAVLDSGICANHPDLSGRILPGYDFVEGDNVPQDEFGHGCQVAGVIAANINNHIGIAGVAPNTLIMPVRVLDAVGSGSYSNVAAAIVYAADNGADVINLSLGGSVSLAILENAVNYAADRGVVVVAAAGNTNGGAVIYPAAYPNAIAVGSLAQDMKRSSFSAVGPEIDAWAPGSSILTTSMTGGYSYASGTSFAAPNVSGVVALYLALGIPFVPGGGLVTVTLPQSNPTEAPAAHVDKYGRPVLPNDERTPTDVWAVILSPGSDPNAVAASLGYINLGQVGTLQDTYLFRVIGSSAGGLAAQSAANALIANTHIIWYEQQVEKPVFSRDVADDPLYAQQWHLPALNLPGTWLAGYTGAGVQVAIVDDGLQWSHPDLASNYFPQGSRDFNGNDGDPSPVSPDDDHGTSVAGVFGAADNTTCGVGVAYNADLAGIRLTGGATTDATKAAALTYANGIGGDTALTNDIYNSSWGPSDNGDVLGGAGLLTLTALQDGATRGRGYRGNIYVWAAGNGGDFYDNVNADSYANSRFAIAVTAVDQLGKYPSYAEPGAPILVSAPGAQGIVTTDLVGALGGGGGECVDDFGGTSASAPMVSGVIALMLEANPNLTWRDVQYILIQTAVQNDPAEPDWTTNGAGYHINHHYGFGLVDAEAAVNLAATWENIGAEGVVTSPVISVNTLIPDAVVPNTCNTPVTSSTEITSSRLAEHVVVRFNAVHGFRGDIAVTLRAPSGTESVLMTQRPFDYGVDGQDYDNWQFMTVRHWGENPTGTWTLSVYDCDPLETGIFQNWQLLVYTHDAPAVPALLSPADGVQLTTNGNQPGLQVALNWTSAAPAHNNGFELYLDIDGDFSDVTPIFVNGTTYTVALPIGAYYWQVRAIGNAAVGDSALSSISQFAIVTPMNLAPPRNFFTTGTPTLTWATVSWATSYRVEVSASNIFTGTLVYSNTVDASQLSVVVDADTSTASLDPLGAGTYYWRVCAVSGATTKCSPWDSFYIDP